jgi:anti-sigma factor (TIGR02949 family)
MSGAPEHLDCEQAADRLYEYLDGELTPAVEAAVRTHLAECAGCFALYDFESAYLRFVEARARARGAPPPLKRKILEQLLFEGDDPEHA